MASRWPPPLRRRLRPDRHRRRRRGTARVAEATGATAAATLAAVAAASDIPVTMLPSSAIVEAVLAGETGVPPRLSARRPVLDDVEQRS